MILERGENPDFVETIFTGFLEKEEVRFVEEGKVPRIVLPDSLLQRLFEGEEVEAQVVAKSTSPRVQAVSVKV